MENQKQEEVITQELVDDQIDQVLNKQEALNRSFQGLNKQIGELKSTVSNMNNNFNRWLWNSKTDKKQKFIFLVVLLSLQVLFLALYIYKITQGQEAAVWLILFVATYPLLAILKNLYQTIKQLRQKDEVQNTSNTS